MCHVTWNTDFINQVFPRKNVPCRINGECVCDDNDDDFNSISNTSTTMTTTNESDFNSFSIHIWESELKTNWKNTHTRKTLCYWERGFFYGLGIYFSNYKKCVLLTNTIAGTFYCPGTYVAVYFCVNGKTFFFSFTNKDRVTPFLNY